MQSTIEKESHFVRGLVYIGLIMVRAGVASLNGTGNEPDNPIVNTGANLLHDGLAGEQY
jgi:hypothetical protein